MDNPTTTTVECILRIYNPTINFNKDLKVNLNPESLEDDSCEFEDIYLGASQTLLQKYLTQMKEPNTQISLLCPRDINRSDFVSFLEDADINKAKADIKTILASLPEDKKTRLLQSLSNM